MEERVRSEFGTHADEALALLARYGTEPWHRERERVQRAILTLSKGDLDLLRHHVEVAQQDYRDVLYWAEYPPDPGDPKTYSELRQSLNLPKEN